MIEWSQISQTCRTLREKRPLVWEYVQSILIAVLVALFIRTFLMQSFLIPSGSMENTLQVGDRIFVNKFIYGTNIPFIHKTILKVRDPQRGDIIVFEYPGEKDKDFIKRVIGTPGDMVEVRNKQVFVNDIRSTDTHEIHRDRTILSGGKRPSRQFRTGQGAPKSLFRYG